MDPLWKRANALICISYKFMVNAGSKKIKNLLWGETVLHGANFVYHMLVVFLGTCMVTVTGFL